VVRGESLPRGHTAVRITRLVLIGVAAACASLALLPAAGATTATPHTFANGAATPGLAAAHFGHDGGPAKAKVVTGDKGFHSNGYNVDGGGWSGAAVTGSGFTSVTATWIEPSVTCHSYNDLMANWVGLDGYGSSTVEQIGVAIDCSSGAPVYQAFYEMYPAGPVYFSLTTYPVRAGDRMTGTVTRSGTTFTLKLTNNTRGWTRTITQSMTASNASAEVILESPTASFPAFGTVNFSNSSINGSLLGNWNPVLMDASANGYYETHTSAVSGGSFSITYLHE
jgi:Peptidase A4 family